MELRSGTRKGDMAAQRQDTPSPPKSDSPPVNQALIPAPATPALVPRKDVQELVNTILLLMILKTESTMLTLSKSQYKDLCHDCASQMCALNIPTFIVPHHTNLPYTQLCP